MLKLAPEATFTATAHIHVPGGDDVPVNFVFRHKGRAALQDYMERAKTLDDVASVGEIVAGWDGIEAEYSPAALAQLLDAYPTAAVAILEAYLAEIGRAAAKN